MIEGRNKKIFGIKVAETNRERERDHRKLNILMINISARLI